MLIQSWRMRFAHFSGKLHQSPAADDAWFWTMQCRVMRFLLRRYDKGGKLSIVTSGDPAMDSSPTNAPPERPGFISSASLARLLSTAQPPRDSQTVRPIVQAITLSNQQRYESLQRQRDEELAASHQAAELQRIEAEWIREHLAFFGIEQPTVHADLVIDDSIEQMFYDYIVADDVPKQDDRRGE